MLECSYCRSDACAKWMCGPIAVVQPKPWEVFDKDVHEGGWRSLEVQLLEREVRLHDARGLHSSPQHILLSGNVILLRYPVQVVQVTARDRECVSENT